MTALPPEPGRRPPGTILFVLPNLEGGGAERAVITLLRHYQSSRLKPHLAVVDLRGPFQSEVPPGIPLYDLRTRRVREGLVSLARLVRRLRPDILFSTLYHLNLALLLMRPFFPRGLRLIIRETSVVSRNLESLAGGRFWKALCRILYPRADRIICLCRAMAEDLSSNLKVPRGKIRCIANPVDMTEILRRSVLGENPFSGQGTGPHLVSAGRLSPEKGFDRLIRGFASLADRQPQARLWILGQGPLEGELKHLARRLGLEEKICFPGFQDNPFVWFKHADLFVLSSHFEGLPNTLLEALVCGCPVVALAHPGGTEEVLENLGLPDRFVPSLEPWLPSWWARPPANVESALIKHFNPLTILEEYNKIFELDR